MSTRAIIAVPLPDGTYETAWCWNDGGPDSLGKELRKHFNTEPVVKELLKEHSFSSIWSPKQIAGLMRAGDRAVCLSNSRCVLIHPHNGNVVAGIGENGLFADIPSMLEEDINYVYAFENGKWNTYK